MPIYCYWGEDEFAMAQAVKTLQQQVLHPDFINFNCQRIPGEQSGALLQALGEAQVPPFGGGCRLVWLAECNWNQLGADKGQADLEARLAQLPTSTVLLFTSGPKPDARLKLVKWLQAHGQWEEFALLSPWQTDQIRARVQQRARAKGLSLSLPLADMVAQAVGNSSRQLEMELEKLSLYGAVHPLTGEAVTALVTGTSQNSLHLAKAILAQDCPQALTLIRHLLARNEPSLRILATLTSQVRTWLWVKLILEDGEQDNQGIAREVEVGNPRRVPHLAEEVRQLPSGRLRWLLAKLLELELSLKQGSPELPTWETKIVELCLMS